MIDPNHDIVPTLRMFDGLMMNIAADEIEKLRARVKHLEARAAASAQATQRESIEAVQRQRMQERFANRAKTPSTADFDLPEQSDRISCYQCKGCGDNDAAPGHCVRCGGSGIEPTPSPDAHPIGEDAANVAIGEREAFEAWAKDKGYRFNAGDLQSAKSWALAAWMARAAAQQAEPSTGICFFCGEPINGTHESDCPQAEQSPAPASPSGEDAAEQSAAPMATKLFSDGATTPWRVVNDPQAGRGLAFHRPFCLQRQETGCTVCYCPDGRLKRWKSEVEAQRVCNRLNSALPRASEQADEAVTELIEKLRDQHKRDIVDFDILLEAATSLEALGADAARYRHLRDCNSGSLVIVEIIGMGEEDQVVLTEDDADKAIDAARAKDSK